MGEWKDTPLREVADLLPGYAFKGMDFGVGTSRVVKIKDVQTGVVAVESLDALDVTGYNQERIKKYRLNAGDHLITMTGNLGRVATIPDNPHSIYVNQRVAKLLPKVNVVEDFLLYVIKSPDFIDYCITHADSETAQPNISAGTILEYKFTLPSKDEQRAIASVLSSLDAKIDLLHRQNKTLEAMAETLFRQWFVEEAEEAWVEVRLDQLADIRGGKQLPTEECKITGLHAVYGANGIMGFAERHTHEGFVIAFGRVGANCGSLFWSHDGAWINNNASSIVPLKWPEYVLQALLAVDFVAKRTGSAQPFIPNNALAETEILLPSEEKCNRYCELVGPWRLKQVSNEKQIRSLTALRDTLLPKLMSGEVRVEEEVLIKD
jgi:type I restriction enzyme S subunit